MSIDAENDEPLIQVLEAVRPQAQAVLAHGDQQAQMGIWLGPPPHVWNDLLKLVMPVLTAHSEFGQGVSFAFGSKQTALHPSFLASRVIAYTASFGGHETVRWLRRLFETQGPTTIRYVAEVFGLRVDSKVELSNGVTIVPLNELPASDNASAVLARYIIRPGPMFPAFDPSVGAYIERSNIARTAQPTNESRSLILERTIRAFTLVEKMAPVIGTSWVEHTEPDLIAADIGRIWMTGWMEGRHPTFSEFISADAIAWVERYIALPEDVRERLDLAISRLNQGRRRLYPGDQAIEAGICLETLLGGRGEKTDMTYKLRLRTARLLEKDFEARKEALKAVNDLYSLRSKTVHGDVTAEDRAGTSVARQGLEIAARVLQATVLNSKLFDTTEIDLKG